MDVLTAVVLSVMGVALIFESFLLMGAMELVKDQAKKLGILTANYKSDLEMTLLHAHNFHEFIHTAEEAMKEADTPPTASSAYS
jgi:hypothetical protein